MNKAAIFHETDSRYCFAIADKSLVIRLRLAKEDREAEVSLIYGVKYEYHKKREKSPMNLVGCDSFFAYYEITLDLADVRLAYVFQIMTPDETIYFSEGGFFSAYDFDLGYQTYFQMPYINKIDVHRSVEWMGKGTFYQIFVDRFNRGDFEKSDDYVTMDWLAKPNAKSFAGGDLLGITQKLDYLEELGITALYLTPIFKSLSNHKYDISDYFAVDPQFGDVLCLKELIHQAHSRGIKVVLDAVFNHSSDLLPEFQDVLKHGKDSQYFDWFMISGEFPRTNPLNYETFASVSSMPKWNTSNPDVQKYLLNVAEFWIKECDIDGWRLDVSDEVSHDFWRKFRQSVKQLKPEAVIIGENWHDAYPWLRGDQFDSIMNYAFSKAVFDYVSSDSLDGQKLSEALTTILMRNTKQVNQMNLNLLDSHDTHRFLTQLNGDKDRMLIALALLLVFEGSPCIYYGTEIAMEGGHDPDCRRGFDWTEVDDSNDYFKKVKELLQLRKNQPVLQMGQTRLTVREDNLFCLKRILGNTVIELRINGGSESMILPETDISFKHLVENNHLLPGGFAIIMDTDRKELTYE